jgi:hypothetical protein
VNHKKSWQLFSALFRSCAATGRQWHGTRGNSSGTTIDIRIRRSCVELWVSPTHVPRKDWRDDPEAVGGVWTEQGQLFGSLSVPADTFYSLFPCLASNHFKELVLKLLWMHYRQGDIDGITFAPKETPMEDLLQ